MTQFEFGFASVGSRLATAFIMSAALALTGCGGSSSSGDSGNPGGGSGGGGDVTFNENPATVSSEADAKESAVAAQQTAEQAINDENSGAGDVASPVGGVALASMSRSEQMRENALDIIDKATLPSAQSATVNGSCGGKAIANTSANSNETRVEYKDYCSGDYVINGYYHFVFSENSANYTTEYDYTITGNGETYSYSGSCNQNGCTNNYVGANGQTYRTQNVSVSGGSSNGYDVSARVYSGELGYIDYKATGLVMCDAPDYGFQSGSITITDSTGSNVVSVNFSGCSSYTVTYGGTGYTVNY